MISSRSLQCFTSGSIGEYNEHDTRCPGCNKIWKLVVEHDYTDINTNKSCPGSLNERQAEYLLLPTQNVVTVESEK